MALPFGQILSAAAPLVLSAVELYRRRHEAAAALPSGAEDDALRERLRLLEETSLEQSRLLAELSRSVEALAKAQSAALEEQRRQLGLLRAFLVATGAVAVGAVALALWALAR